MTAILTQKAQLLLSAKVRRKLHLSPKDELEVSIEDDDTFTLRRISNPPNRGLVDLLISCPPGLIIPPREKDDSDAMAL
jgi:bifunctional DNA-binding transcriptional regulator/antitoxin component of YhaV-PrlF toxin-antitoxin module